LRDRFGIINRLDFYTPEHLEKIVIRSSNILQTEITQDAAFELSGRSRGTPRIANRLLRRTRDFAQVKSDGVIEMNITRKALEAMEIDRMGFDEMDKKLLMTIINKYSGGPVGLETLASSIREEKDTIEDVYEPFLLQEGFIERTPRGRVATNLAYEHFGIKKADEKGLF